MHGTRTLSEWLSWFDNVLQYTEVAESNVLQYIAFFVFFYTNIT